MMAGPVPPLHPGCKPACRKRVLGRASGSGPVACPAGACGARLTRSPCRRSGLRADPGALFHRFLPLSIVRRLFRFLIVLALCAGVLAAAGAWWVQRPLPLRAAPGESVDFAVKPRTGTDDIARAVVAAGVDTPAWLLSAWFRLSGQGGKIRAGQYEVSPGTTPRQLLTKLVRGEQSLQRITLVEGWSLRQVRAALAAAPGLRAESKDLSDEALMQALGRPGVPAEGRFFPDTYLYGKGSSDLAVLRLALQAMDRQLDAAWSLRSADTPLKSPQQLLTLASIVEKETGRAEDRPHVAAVFLNRLRIGMRLQTDPTVIYGIGPDFDGNLRRRDLQTDTPYNTYTRAGLPPTPIAMPGRASLLAAVQPADSKALYFVARGDGSSQFSRSLDEHNRAVNRYQRGGGAPAAPDGGQP